MLKLLCISIISVIQIENVLLVNEDEHKCPEDCKNLIYCNEEILHTVQLSEFFDNSQNFVDMKLKHLPKNILEKFEAVKATENNEERNRELEKFINDNFEPELLSDCEWNNFPERPEIDEIVTDENYKNFYKNINKEWKQFAVKIPDNFQNEPENLYHSITYVPNCYMKEEKSYSMPTLVQTYWIIRGMLINKMFDEVEEMLRNYAYLIEKYCFTPYTNRVYALDRAQYPFLALMVEDYLERAENKPEFLQQMLPAIEKEYKWWESNRKVRITINHRTYYLFRFYQNSCNPRPEVYKNDYNLAKNLELDLAKKRFYSALRCLNGCGFDFSSRFLNYKKYSNPLLNLKVSNIVPVELNSVLHRYAILLGKWYTNVDDKKSKIYSSKSKIIQRAINAVLWSSSKNMWFDYDSDKKETIYAFYVTNLMPLFTRSYDDKEIGAKVAQFLYNEKLIGEQNFPTYLLMPTTLEQDTGLLGDFPYGSLFLTAFVIEGLGKTEDNRALEIASNMARSLIKTVYNGYEHDKNLLERYIVLPNSKMAKNYNEENKGKISAASLGCIISLLAQYGRVATSADYEAILTADIYSSQELVFASPRSTIDDWIDDTILDSESEEGVIPTETDDTEELENAETNAKRQKIE